MVGSIVLFLVGIGRFVCVRVMKRFSVLSVMVLLFVFGLVMMSMWFLSLRLSGIRCLICMCVLSVDLCSLVSVGLSSG